jgi:hypothetical protein
MWLVLNPPLSKLHVTDTRTNYVRLVFLGPWMLRIYLPSTKLQYRSACACSRLTEIHRVFVPVTSRPRFQSSLSAKRHQLLCSQMLPEPTDPKSPRPALRIRVCYPCLPDDSVSIPGLGKIGVERFGLVGCCPTYDLDQDIGRLTTSSMRTTRSILHRLRSYPPKPWALRICIKASPRSLFYCWPLKSRFFQRSSSWFSQIFQASTNHGRLEVLPENKATRQRVHPRHLTGPSNSQACF